MKKDISIRESNFELMRIISMIMIIIYHIIVHGKIIEHTSGFTYIVLNFILALIIVHVNSFIILMGYFQHDKKIKLTKVIALNNSVWFYGVVIMLITITFNLMALQDIGILQTLLPVSFYDYWFISLYIVLYLISPVLNIVIRNVDKKKHFIILCILFILCCLLPTLTKQMFFNNSRGFSLYNFIFLYFVGAYIKKYPINSNYFFKVFSNNAKRLIYVFIFFFFAVFNVLLYLESNELINMNFIAEEIAKVIRSAFLAYDNPLVIAQSILYFAFFTTFTFKSKFINYISKFVIGVYLFHDNSILRFLIYDFFGFNKNGYGITVLFRIAIVTIIIFVVGIIIEIIRQWIFKIIYNLKISKKNRLWYRNYIKSLGINVNW